MKPGRLREPVDQVLQATDDLLSQPGTRSVADAEVLRKLAWPNDRLSEVQELLAQLIEEGDLRGPRNGPLRGDNRIVAVDLLGVTQQGRLRLAEASRPWWRRAGRWSAARVRATVGAVVVAIIVALAVAVARRLIGV